MFEKLSPEDLLDSLFNDFFEKDVSRFAFTSGVGRLDAEEAVSTAYHEMYNEVLSGKISPDTPTDLHRLTLKRCGDRCKDHIRRVTAKKFVKSIPLEPENLDYVMQAENVRSTRQTLVLLSTKKSIGSARQELLTDTFRLFCKTDTDKMFAEVLMEMVHANETSSFDCTEVARQCHNLYELTGTLDSTRRKVSRFFERLRIFISKNRNFVEDYHSLTSLLA